jgi:cytochrome c oxidase assembly factor CtaG
MPEIRLELANCCSVWSSEVFQNRIIFLFHNKALHSVVTLQIVEMKLSLHYYDKIPTLWAVGPIAAGCGRHMYVVTNRLLPPG